LKIAARLIFNMTMMVAMTLSSGCFNHESKGGNNDRPSGPNSKNKVNWDTVPSDYHPEVQENEFRTGGFKAIHVDAFSFKDDVEVLYGDKVPNGSVFVRAFTVWKETELWQPTSNWRTLRARPNGSSLDLKSEGSYSCYTEVVNGDIQTLAGGCFVRLEIWLPQGAEIEVYNLGQLISKRFFPMETSTMMTQLEQSIDSDAKFSIIDTYLASYLELNKKPSITTQQLKPIIQSFSFDKDKHKALRLLHSFVTDRQNLSTLIDELFTYFEREEARRTVGL
jgi:hypothetical protein